MADALLSTETAAPARPRARRPRRPHAPRSLVLLPPAALRQVEDILAHLTTLLAADSQPTARRTQALSRHQLQGAIAASMRAAGRARFPLGLRGNTVAGEARASSLANKPLAQFDLDALARQGTELASLHSAGLRQRSELERELLQEEAGLQSDERYLQRLTKQMESQERAMRQHLQLLPLASDAPMSAAAIATARLEHRVLGLELAGEITAAATDQLPTERAENETMARLAAKLAVGPDYATKLRQLSRRLERVLDRLELPEPPAP